MISPHRVDFGDFFVKGGDLVDNELKELMRGRLSGQ
jgi:hypothetical protein